jgi:hypothetical protein
VQTALVVADLGGSNDAADLVRTRAAHGFRLVTSRKPTDAEVERIVQAFTAQLDEFRRTPENARLVAGDGASGADAAERAAWTMVANALLNLDEAVTK